MTGKTEAAVKRLFCKHPRRRTCYARWDAVVQVLRECMKCNDSVVEETVYLERYLVSPGYGSRYLGSVHIRKEKPNGKVLPLCGTQTWAFTPTWQEHEADSATCGSCKVSSILKVRGDQHESNKLEA